MGQVWLGHDVDGHALAFKLLRSEFAEDPNVVARFLTERTLLLSIDSPYVIRVLDLVIEGPRLAIVLEYIPGPSLRDVINQQGNLAPADVARIGAQMARGLAEVHRAGILHRDFKPENVLIETGSNGAAKPKIVDFGIAQLADPAGGGGTASIIGTPQYLAPELGDGQPASTSSDLYALGVTLYELSCGVVPFNAPTPLALLRLHADHAPGRPEGIPDSMWDLITHLMAKNPQARPGDASAIAHALEVMATRLPQQRTAPVIRLAPPPSPLTGTNHLPGPSAVPRHQEPAWYTDHDVPQPDGGAPQSLRQNSLGNHNPPGNQAPGRPTSPLPGRPGAPRPKDSISTAVLVAVAAALVILAVLAFAMTRQWLG